MATRGTAYLLLKDDCVYSTEFNGDMYPEGNGDYFFEGIYNIKNEMEFIDFIIKFNAENFGYDEDLIYSDENTYFYDTISEDELLIDFRENYFDRFFSDWTFFKNLSSLPVRVVTRDGKETILYDGDSRRFYFGGTDMGE